ncbi:Fpg/Nei family DNA glycosylase [Aquiluna sp.]|nr:Fpg/Nei family DNA glycosylase [Aquiluna sp.]
MPEGHTVHRIAKRFQKEFLGSKLAISSPQGRFTDAQLVSGRELTKADAWGKQLFLHFDDLAIRIHLGIYGKWRFTAGDTPEVTGQVRARFELPGMTADLRGPTACEVIDRAGIKSVQSRLGPDPLRPDRKGFERERFISKLTSRKTAVGQQLMDQSVIAGIGNVYRAELLFRSSINPHTPGTLLPLELADQIWEDSVTLMPIGVRTGLMLTREGHLKGRPKLADRYYVYKREGQPCRECGQEVTLELMASRKLYYCARCQK